ncbi:MAG: DNA (cytosine-5-)-methyltransferase [Dongiaceae bacterium]
MGVNKDIDASVVDVFCGAGGLSHGFSCEGFPIAAGIDIDEACRYPFQANNSAPFVCRDVTSVTAEELNRLFYKSQRRVLVGCAPCQPFSIYNQGNSDLNWQLLPIFAKLICEVRPDVVSMENVPRLVRFNEGGPFVQFVHSLECAGYHVAWDVVYCPDYGLPQTRSRLVLLASQLGEIKLPKPTHKKRHKTVREAIGSLPSIKAGEIHHEDALHRASMLSEINIRRIRASRSGGTWRDWDDELVAKCHREETGESYPSVYGRMKWDEPAPTITTQFFGFGNGRFGHPQQHRALSLREGAILQGFPKDYAFVEPGRPIHFKSVGRLIGNAVPVHLARAIARMIRRHLKDL